jgi:type IV pilus assembly protein PilC
VLRIYSDNMPSIDISAYGKKNRPKVKAEGKGLLDLLGKDISFGSSQLSDRKKEGFYNELGTLIRSGIDIRSALELTVGSYTNKKDVELFASVQQKVIGGKSLSETMQGEEKFSAYEYYSVKIGEETGRLSEVLGELAKYYKAKISQRRKIIGAITYPLLVLVTSFAAVFFMIKFVVPMFADVFQRFGGKLPYLTSLIVSFSDWLDRYIYLMLGVIVLVVVLVHTFSEIPTNGS